MKRKLYIDMDGTTAMFYEKSGYLEAMYTEGFFRNLNPYRNCIIAIQKIVDFFALKNASEELEVFVLTSILSDAEWSKMEKIDWNREFLPFIDEAHIIFTKCGEPKTKNLKIDSNSFLLDDYNVNLEDWRNHGGQTIKFVNEINDRGLKGPLWNGHRIRYDYPPERIAKEILDILQFPVGDYEKLPDKVRGNKTTFPEGIAREMKKLLAEYNSKEN